MIYGGRIKSSAADQVNIQFAAIFSEVENSKKELFERFTMQKNWLNDFYYSLLGHDENSMEVFEVLKLFMILSHGSAWVESRFLVNSDLIVENLSKEYLVAQC